MKKRNFILLLSAVSVLLAGLSIAILHFVFKQKIIIPLIFLVFFIAILVLIYSFLDSVRIEENNQIEKNLDVSLRQALQKGKVGVLIYNDDYEITWMSDFFGKIHLEHLQEKILNWLPEMQDVIEGKTETKIVVINDDKYQVSKIDNNPVLIFEDITKEYDYNKQLEEDAYVVGVLSYDNYDESNMSEDDISFVNANIKVPVIEYFKNFNVLYKTLKNNIMLLILNEANFSKIMNDRFSILSQVRKVGKDNDLNVTLSMGFARGSDSFTQLDATARELLELAQTRGGDQCVVKKIGEDPLYFGGNTEAREKQSKTRVRVMVSSISDLIKKADNVVICCHKNIDADCLGAALCMSNYALSLQKQSYIVCKTGDIDPMINEVLNKYKTEIESKHNLVGISDVENLDFEHTLFIMVDHHLASQSNASELLKKAQQIVIIDHHRRHAQLDVVPLMVYIEAAASSTVEITVEFLSYLSHQLQISEQEANIMYLGLLIDTDNFRLRTGIRTFDVAKQLRNYGADPLLCNELIQESYQSILERSNIINTAKIYQKGVIIACQSEGVFNRTIAAQTCDALVKAKEIAAAFVICNIGRNEVVISARSKGKINVQRIMERMNGGGHLMASGVQIENSDVNSAQKNLISVLDEYFKEEEENARNIVE